MKQHLCISILLTILISSLNAQQAIPSSDSIQPKMQWFADAKLGIFIHWGIYSVKGVGESWSFHNKRIPYSEYMSQLKGFTGAKYDPQAWADLIKQSGARYAVITTKHHDGVALWNTKASDLNVVKKTPFKKDAIAPFFAALRKDSIKCGAYFSLLDWSNPDYPGFLKDSSRYTISQNPTRWKKFLQFNNLQMSEIMQQYRPDLIWFDGDWEHNAAEWEASDVRKMLLSYNPELIINGRLTGYGDYETPEQNFPVSRPAYKWWELCMTTNDSWGFQPTDTAWKSPYEVITIFVDAVANGGNLLLDIGPRADGSIPREQINILKELGDWNKRNGESIFGTLPGLALGHFYGPTTLSKDSTTLYLFLHGRINGQIMLKGIRNNIKGVSVVGTNASLSYKVVGKISWSPIPGLVYIDVPESQNDKYVTVVKVKLDGPIHLYRGKGGLSE
ncbi:MAG: alpha-L-fucosidase [Bacteroidetes bacterium]|nr:alpha-L-fucosidase [Bacteroidota bacterium]